MNGLYLSLFLSLHALSLCTHPLCCAKLQNFSNLAIFQIEPVRASNINFDFDLSHTYAALCAAILSYRIRKLVIKLLFELSGFILSLSLSVNKHFLLLKAMFVVELLKHFQEEILAADLCQRDGHIQT